MYFRTLIFSKQVPWYKRLWYRRELLAINALLLWPDYKNESCRIMLEKILELESKLKLPGVNCFDNERNRISRSTTGDKANWYLYLINSLNMRIAGAFPHTIEEADKLVKFIEADNADLKNQGYGSDSIDEAKKYFLNFLRDSQRFECYEQFLALERVNQKLRNTVDYRHVHGKKLYELEVKMGREAYIKDPLYLYYIDKLDFDDLKIIYDVHGPFSENQDLNSMQYLTASAARHPAHVFEAIMHQVSWNLVRQRVKDAGYGFSFVRRLIERIKDWWSPTQHPFIKKAEALTSIRANEQKYMLIPEERQELISSLIEVKDKTFSEYTKQRVNILSHDLLGHDADLVTNNEHLKVEELSILSKHQFSEGIMQWKKFLTDQDLCTIENLGCYTILRGLEFNGYSVKKILSKYESSFVDKNGQEKLNAFINHLPLVYVLKPETVNDERDNPFNYYDIVKENFHFRCEILRCVLEPSLFTPLKSVLATSDHAQHSVVWGLVCEVLQGAQNLSFNQGSELQVLKDINILLKYGFKNFEYFIPSGNISSTCESLRALVSICHLFENQEEPFKIIKSLIANNAITSQLIDWGKWVSDHNYQFLAPEYYESGMNEIQYLFSNAKNIANMNIDIIKAVGYLRLHPREVVNNDVYDVSELMDGLMKLDNQSINEINRKIVSVFEHVPNRNFQAVKLKIKRMYAAYIRSVTVDSLSAGILHTEFMALLNECENEYRYPHRINRRAVNNGPVPGHVDVHTEDFEASRSDAYTILKNKCVNIYGNMLKQERNESTLSVVTTSGIRDDLASKINEHILFDRKALAHIVEDLIDEKNPLLVQAYFQHIYIRRLVIKAANRSTEFKTWFITAMNTKAKQRTSGDSFRDWYDNAKNPIASWKSFLSSDISTSVVAPSYSCADPYVYIKEYYKKTKVPDLYANLSWYQLFSLADGLELCISSNLNNTLKLIPADSFLKNRTSFDNKTSEEILYLVWSYAWCEKREMDADSLKLKIMIALGEIRAAYYYNSHDEHADISCPKGALERLLDTIAAEDPAFRAIVPKSDSAEPLTNSTTEVSYTSATISNYFMRIAAEQAISYLSKDCTADEAALCYDKESKTWTISSELWCKIESQVKDGIMAECGTPLSPKTTALINDVISSCHVTGDPLYSYVSLTPNAEQTKRMKYRLQHELGSSSSSSSTVLFMHNANREVDLKPDVSIPLESKIRPDSPG